MNTDRSLHLNLVAWHAAMVECSGGVVRDLDGVTCGAGAIDRPGVLNFALRTDDSVPGDEALRRAQEFFGGIGRRFTFYARSPADADVIDAASSAGRPPRTDAPQMVARDVATAPPVEGIEVREVTDGQGVDDYRAVATDAFSTIGLSPLVPASALTSDFLVSPASTGFVTYRGDRPVGCAQLFMTEGVAGLFWGGTVRDEQRGGVGAMFLQAAANAGFERGAAVASLQASSVGVELYRRFGFVEIWRYASIVW